MREYFVRGFDGGGRTMWQTSIYADSLKEALKKVLEDHAWRLQESRLAKVEVEARAY